jgi:PAS domain S-box-containing protein
VPDGDERFRSLLDAIPAVVYEAEPPADGAWHYVSGYVETLLGYPPEDFIADPLFWASRIHPDDREAVLRVEDDQFEAARAGDVTVVNEYRLLHRDGHAVWVRDEARLAGDPRRPVWQGVWIDIAAERALVEAYDRYRSLVEGLPVCLYRSEPGAEARWSFVSPQIEQVLGYSAAELMSDPTLRIDLIHPDDRDWLLSEESNERDAAPGTHWVREYRLVHRSGRPVWVRDRGVASGAPDRPRVAEGVLTDITAARATAEEAPGATDVYRLTCQQCGAVWAAERLEICRRCGSGEVDAVSLDETLRELTSVSRQLDGLLQGIQGHLEMLKSTLGARPETAREPAARDEFRVVHRGDDARAS